MPRLLFHLDVFEGLAWHDHIYRIRHEIAGINNSGFSYARPLLLKEGLLFPNAASMAHRSNNTIGNHQRV